MDEVLEHQRYLADVVRLEAYAAALARTVMPGDVVLDLGTGTGVLGLLALRAGAGRVYGVDGGAIVGLAREVARANNASSISFLRANSRRVTLPEPVDVVVCDQMGAFGFEAGLLSSYEDAYQRHVKPGGRLIPYRIGFQFAPVSVPRLRELLSFWDSRPQSLDFTKARDWSVDQTYSWRLDREQILGTACDGVTLDLATWGERQFTMRGESVIEREGLVDGVSAWFVAELAPRIVLTNSPIAAASISRGQAVLPFTKALAVTPGERLEISIRVNPAVPAISWTVARRSVSGAVTHTERRSTLLGALFTEEDVEFGRASATPVLSLQGKAQLRVLQLADGNHDVAAICQLCESEFPMLFGSTSATSAFVASVLDGARR